MTTIFRRGFIFAASAMAAATLWVPPAFSAEFSDAQRTEIGAIVRDYLVKHPEVLQEAYVELEKRQAEAESQRHREAVAANSDAIFNAEHDVVLGNPKGDVTFVEFFDYNCGYCKRALSDMLTLMKNDPNLRIVLKEFPVLGQGSVEAAQVASAVRMQDPTGKKYLEFHLKLLGSRGQADRARALAVAKAVGVDMARLEKDLKNPEINNGLKTNFQLAEKMGLNGTPSYVIGKEVAVGAVGLDTLREKISLARCGKATC